MKKTKQQKKLKQNKRNMHILKKYKTRVKNYKQNKTKTKIQHIKSTKNKATKDTTKDKNNNKIKKNNTNTVNK